MPRWALPPTELISLSLSFSGHAGAFIPELLSIALARIGIEPAQTSNFFDDWSHSLLSVAILASLFALAFRRRGRPVVLAIWLAVFSHFVLDFPVHPKRLALAPLTRIYLGWDLLALGFASGLAWRNQ